MIRSSRRPAGRRLLVLAIAALIPALAGCEAGNNAPTQEWHQPTDGFGTVHHDIAIRNVFVLGAAIGSTIKAGGSAGVFLALINNGSADKLVKISAPGTAKSVTLPGGSVSLPSQKAGAPHRPGAQGRTGGSDPPAHRRFERPAGADVPERLERAHDRSGHAAGAVYSTFSPPSPTPSATPTTKGKHKSATATPSASPSPSASS